jgi:hypothetical protein
VICIGHEENGRFIVDVIRGRQAPFDPQSVTAEFAALAKQYGCREITADNYSAGWAESEFTSHGIRLKRSELPKSQLYIESLPLFMRNAARIPDHPRLLRELRLLERRTSRIGKDIVDHGRGGRDDYANALCGMLRGLAAPRFVGGYGCLWIGMGPMPPGWGKKGQQQPTEVYEPPTLEQRTAEQLEAHSRNIEARQMILKARGRAWSSS